MLKLALLFTFLALAWGHPHSYYTRDASHNIPPRNKARVAATEDSSFWLNLGQDILKAELLKKPIHNKAKNVILFLGDGMSIPTITAARIYEGQKLGQTGEEYKLSFEQFPYAALSKTYCVDSQVADSACSATAYVCGVKTNIGTIGVDANVQKNDCPSMNKAEYRTPSVWKWAQDAGKATGVVTTTRITHATPASTYAHTANRDWESDSDIVYDRQNTTLCDDIAEQLVFGETGKKLKVAMGGGRRSFFPTSVKDPETGKGGYRLDGVNLVQAWLDQKTGSNASYVTSRDELLNLDLDNTDYLLGMFASGHMEYFVDSENANNPTLEEMTISALKVLQKSSEGFVLMVEGGRIDEAHHDGHATVAMEETSQFDKAIKAALSMTNPEETLIVVTADHSHTLTINGYPDRGNPILGLAQLSDVDNLPYTTLSYATGPGYAPTPAGGRPDLTNVDTAAKTFKQPATYPLGSESHGGDDVAIFAYGPQAHLFQGVYEENYIAHVMAYAACIGPGLHFCDA